MKPAAPSLPDVTILHPVRVIATAFYLLTRQQPWAAERLTRHAGKTLRVAVGAFHVTLTVGHDGHLSQADPAIVPDVILDVVPERLNVSRILSIRQGGDFSDLIQVSGEASLAQVVSELARDLRPDPEDLLAGWVGDIPATRIVGGLRATAEAALGVVERFSQNVAEYLSEEAGALVGKPAMAALESGNVETLAQFESVGHRLTALAARIERLERMTGQRP